MASPTNRLWLAAHHVIDASAVGLVVFGLLMVGCGHEPPEPVRVSGPDDFRAVVDQALMQARQALPAVADCIGDLTVRAERDLDDRARYHGSAITIRVPATAPRIEELVVHELAHHLDATCVATDDVRDRFRVAQGSDHDWSSGPSWEETPAEQFAEAMTLVVLGRQRAHNVRVDPDAVQVVREWAG